VEVRVEPGARRGGDGLQPIRLKGGEEGLLGHLDPDYEVADPGVFTGRRGGEGAPEGVGDAEKVPGEGAVAGEISSGDWG